ncbi:LysR substrate-binding domain-containing protein [Mesobacterium sp. TK19101]|uniref:LysR substrate-binding domain-containing protein n=1 Tax=Mesobacterium hydrothermale TaxID=3111907 RepID=A0ABU6HMJ4_9RHOB|nr:LysR substrate-binding domain-containing protein [Mesobacterium sp. TK19101]MEC3863139.1 LysR substrate-binding domain-containing protein [Mesobacterium sp. TK19101]
MPSRHIRMRHLRCFQAVARQGSVTRAAEALGTVQPSVSRSLRELEEDMGTQLFTRTSNGLVLNDAGRMFMAYVSGGLSQIERGIEAMQGRMAGDRIVAYVLPNVVRMIMPGAVRRFKDLYPEIDISFLAATSGGLQQLLSRGEVDFGFGRLLAAEHMEGMNFEHLFSEPLVFFVRNDHPLARRSAIDIYELDRFPVLLPNQGTIIRSEIDRFTIGQGLSRFTNVIETISFEFARRYVMETDSIVCYPLGAMKQEVAQGFVTPLEFGQGAMMGAVGVTTSAGRTLSAPAQLLVQMIREEVHAQNLS